MSSLTLAPLPTGRYVSRVNFGTTAPEEAPKSRFSLPALRKGGLRRGLVTFVAALLAMVIGLGGVAQTASTQRAEAGFFDDMVNGFTSIFENMFCGDEAYYYEAGSHQSVASGIGLPMIHKDKVQPNKIATAYEKYGLSGTTFSVYRGTESGISRSEAAGIDRSGAQNLDDDDPRMQNGCMVPMPMVESIAANTIFTMTKIVTGLAIWFYGLAFQPEWMEELSNAVETVIVGTSQGNGLRDVLYFPYLNLMILLGALYLGWVGLVKRASMQAANSALWMVGAVLTGSLLMFNPSFLPDMANRIVGSVESAILSGTAGVALGAASDNNENNFCYVPSAGVSERDLTIRQMECSLWATFVYAPWVTGQFGVDVAEANEIAKGSGNELNVQIGSRTFKENIALYQLDAQSKDFTVLNDDAAVADKADQWFHVADYLAENSPSYFDTWEGGNGERIGITVLSLVSAGAGLVAIIVTSLSMIVYGLMMIMLIFVSVLFLLVGAHPGMGRGISLRWAEMMVSTILKRIMAAAILGIMLAFYAVVLNAGMGFALTMITIIALSIAGLGFRKNITDVFSQVSFGGTQSGLEGGVSSGTHRVGATLGMALMSGTSAIATGGAVRAGMAAAAARPGRSAAGNLAAGIAGGVKTLGSATARGAKAGAMSGRMSGAAALMGVQSSREAIMDATQKYERKRQERSQEHNQKWNEQNPETAANKKRETERRIAKYASDYAKNKDNPEWHKAFKDAYGFEAPDPEKQNFPGYGVRPNPDGKLPLDLRPVDIKRDEDQDGAPKNNGNDGGTPPPRTDSDGGNAHRPNTRSDAKHKEEPLGGDNFWNDSNPARPTPPPASASAPEPPAPAPNSRSNQSAGTAVPRPENNGPQASTVPPARKPVAERQQSQPKQAEAPKPKTTQPKAKASNGNGTGASATPPARPTPPPAAAPGRPPANDAPPARPTPPPTKE